MYQFLLIHCKQAFSVYDCKVVRIKKKKTPYLVNGNNMTSRFTEVINMQKRVYLYGR